MTADPNDLKEKTLFEKAFTSYEYCEENGFFAWRECDEDAGKTTKTCLDCGFCRVDAFDAGCSIWCKHENCEHAYNDEACKHFKPKEGGLL